MFTGSLKLGITKCVTVSVLAGSINLCEDDVEYHVKVYVVGNKIQIFIDEIDAALLAATDERRTVEIVVDGTAPLDEISVARPLEGTFADRSSHVTIPLCLARC